jgi:hypothetical protein
MPLLYSEGALMSIQGIEYNVDEIERDYSVKDKDRVICTLTLPRGNPAGSAEVKVTFNFKLLEHVVGQVWLDAWALKSLRVDPNNPGKIILTKNDFEGTEYWSDLFSMELMPNYTVVPGEVPLSALDKALAQKDRCHALSDYPLGIDEKTGVNCVGKHGCHRKKGHKGLHCCYIQVTVPQNKVVKWPIKKKGKT